MASYPVECEHWPRQTGLHVAVQSLGCGGHIVEIEPPDSHCVSAAIGWLELGNPAEAAAELNKVSQRYSQHPDILELRWTIQSQLKQWLESVETAKALTEVAPRNAFGWVHLSYSLHELKRTREAYDNLLQVLERFPNDWLMRYNMACYAAQLGRLEEAERWLAGAMIMGDREKIKKMAAEDADLAPLFAE